MSEAQVPSYFPEFSHEFPDGPSGPARSYWTLRFGTVERSREIGGVCLHHRDSGMSPANEAMGLCWLLAAEFERGRRDKLAEIKAVLSV